MTETKDSFDAEREIKLAITRGIGIWITDPEEIELREALVEVYLTEGFGGHERSVHDRADAERLIAERLTWLRNMRSR